GRSTLTNSVKEALSIAEWLASGHVSSENPTTLPVTFQGVRPTRIKLFLSSRPNELPAIIRDCEILSASHDCIYDSLTEAVHKWSNEVPANEQKKCLFIFWAGHGFNDASG